MIPLAVLLAAPLDACTPPWYYLDTVMIDARAYPDGRCEATARGDVTRRISGRGFGMYDGTYFTWHCAPPIGPAPSESKVAIYMELSTARATTTPEGDTVRAVAPGVYPVADDEAWTHVSSPGQVAVQLIVDSVPNGATFGVRHYRAERGTITLREVTPRLGGVHVVGVIHAEARRYFSSAE